MCSTCVSGVQSKLKSVSSHRIICVSGMVEQHSCGEKFDVSCTLGYGDMEHPYSLSVGQLAQHLNELFDTMRE